jgi:2-polyprenyl-3-methyl-5-hydroxy-6-metoxy-1,4-benzoquinol methylase
MTTHTHAAPNPERLRRKVSLIAGMMTGAHVAAMIALGLRLGLYQRLVGAGAVTSVDLAQLSGLHERWLREWLRGQAAAGILEYRGNARFELSPEVATLLADTDNMMYLGGTFAGIPHRMRVLEDLPEAFRTGIGFSWDDRGSETASFSELTLRNWYREVLVGVALPMLDDVVQGLTAGGKVADVGCGAGLAILQMARAFPKSEFHGYEISAHALARAAEHRSAARVTNVTLHNAATNPLPGDALFDLITTFDCLHDMTHPEDVARAIRNAIRPAGVWFIADIDGAPTFEEQLQSPRTPLLYAMSVLGCMPSSLSEPGGAGLGTLGLPEPAMRQLVESAGFTRFRRIDLPHPINAFYEARP